MSLFDPAPVLSAPYWFIEFFKIVGFALHLVPMGIWLVGLPCAIVFWLFGGVNTKRLAQRLFQQTPIFTAFGVNFGIVPLLFIQLAYPKVFYTSTILIAVHWLGILFFVFLAYLFSYLCASGAKKEYRWRTLLFACLSFLFFVAVGLIFSSEWSLFERPYEWEEIWASSKKSFNIMNDLFWGGFASTNGLGLYWHNILIFLRFAGIFGLAFYTVAFWIVFDAFFLYKGPRTLTDEEEMLILEASESDNKNKKRFRLPIQENPEKYPFIVVSIACCLTFLGLLVSVPALGDYLLKRINVEAMLSQETSGCSPIIWKSLFYCQCVSLLLPFIFFVFGKLKKLSGKTLALCLLFCELLIVGCYATLRQIIQNLQLASFFKPDQLSVESQWSSIFVFLGVFIVALGLIAYIVKLMASTNKEQNNKIQNRKVKASKKTEAINSANKNKGKKDVEKESSQSSSNNVAGLTIATSHFPQNGKKQGQVQSNRQR